jgi:cell division protein FtsB
MRKILFPALLGVAAYFALFGGEYSVFELRQARREAAKETAELARLRREIDSLAARADSLETDSATLEQVAREGFGMVREGEVLYRFTSPPDSTDEGRRN